MILYNQSGLLTIGGVEFTAYSGHGDCILDVPGILTYK